MLLYGKDPVCNVVLNGHEFVVARARLGGHVRLRLIAEQEPSAQAVRDYLAICGVVEEASAVEMLSAFLVLQDLNKVGSQIPFVIDNAVSERKVPWDYNGRWAVSWIHTLSKTYGWTREEILDLDVDEAMGYVQEIAVDEHVNAEFNHSLSQNAFEYDTLGHGKYKPLQRPLWMLPKQPKTRMLKSMIPSGAILGPLPST